MFSSRGTVRYDERGQGYRDVEKVGKHCFIVTQLRYCQQTVFRTYKIRSISYFFSIICNINLLQPEFYI